MDSEATVRSARHQLSQEQDLAINFANGHVGIPNARVAVRHFVQFMICLLYTSDAADERSSVDLGGRRIIKKKKKRKITGRAILM